MPIFKCIVFDIKKIKRKCCNSNLILMVEFTSSLTSSSSVSVDIDGTLGLCHDICSRRSLNFDVWFAA